uniref:Uncharacterized protein n=1 Tax=Ciona savignyi TaxID=51511 RepID=H2YLP0_CIOSA
MMVMPESIPFLDQCRVICLNYAKQSCKDSTELENRNYLENFVEKELQAFDFPLDVFLSAALKFKDMKASLNVKETQMQNTVEVLLNRDLNQKSYDAAASTLLDGDHVKSHNEIAILLQLMYNAIKESSYLNIEEIIDLSAKGLRNLAKEFVSLNGWTQGEQQSEVTSSEFLSSIVMLSAEGCSSPGGDHKTGSVHDDVECESFDSATPPEIVERPPMTASFMQMMGGGDVNLSAYNSNEGSEGNGFEMVASMESCTLDVANPDPPTPSDESVSAPSNETDKVEQLHHSKQTTSNISSFLPQISIGVAAAAACIGFIMLKKNS